MIILGPSQSESYNMGKNRKLKLSQERSIGSESSEESIFGQGCPHVKKAVNFMAMRKVVLKEKLGDCRDCIRKGNDSNTKGQKPPDTETLIDGYEPTLWICLQCGHQGCDRNSQDKHALKHYETPRSSSHLIVINTTSWSTWCYKCDDEIPIEKHKKIIECLDFLKQQAGVSKLTLDSGKKEASSRLSNDTASENKGENKTAKGKAALSKNANSVMNVRIKGLSNLGNTCFFNAVLQNLSQTHGLENMLKDGNKKGASLSLPGWQPLGTDSCSEISDDSSDEDHSEDNTQAMPPIDITIPEPGPLTRSLLAFLHEMTTSSNHNSTINPCSLFGQVCKKAPRFKGFQQQDSHELLRYLLDVMRNEEIRRARTGILRHFKLSENTNPNKVDNKTKTKIKEYGRQAKHTFIDRLFGGHLISTVSCEVCQHMSQIFEPFLDLSLPVTEEKVKHPAAERKQKRMAKKVAKWKARQDEDEEEMENEKETHKTEEIPTCNEIVDTSDADIEDNVENEVTPSNKKSNETNMNHHSMKEENKKEVGKTDSTLLTNDSKMPSKVASQNSLKMDSNGSTDGLHKELNQLTNRFECLQLTDKKTASNSEEDSKSCPTGDKIQDSNRSEQDCPQKKSEEQSEEQSGSFVAAETNGIAPLLHMACSSEGLEKGAIEASESVSKCNETDGSEQSAEIVTELPGKETNDASEEMPINNGSAFANHSGEGQGPVMASKSSSSSSIRVAQLLSNCSHGPPLAHPEEEDIDDVDEKEYINMSTIKRQAQAKSMSTLSPRYQPSSRECSIMSCLHQFTSAELLMGNNKVRCKNCTRRKAKNSSNNAAAEKEVVYTNASKQFLIFRPPAILTLHLKRFEQIGFSSRKVNRHVDFPFVLDIAPFCSALSQSVKKGQKNVLYSLYGIVEHNGRLSGGHYTAYVKVCKNNINKPNNFLSESQLDPKEYILRYRTLLLSGSSNEKVEPEVDVDNLVPSGKWYHISDSHVREVSETAVKNAQAYLLFYERIY
ncbi:USP16_45 [Acanthosepion pharaonis]|uniref:ubiquitinyl hydrolase 1 n=1 Tax=Acanthosepion pharaonis TaxID=158019 RepID=A0A812DS43_ACAPH|nr:USP16_45 [Sepia pharaonis]